MAAFDSSDKPDDKSPAEVEIGSAPSAALGQLIVSTLQDEGIPARLDGTRIMVPGRLQTKAREILDFLRAEIAKSPR